MDNDEKAANPFVSIVIPAYNRQNKATILIDKLVGNLVNTSDHGELLGEYNDFGHPCGSDIDTLLYVPYFIVRV